MCKFESLLLNFPNGLITLTGLEIGLNSSVLVHL